ncbi:hypothetical protein PNEG_03407 [Pneumocystis murina B123]|uniref:Uncharacterized protein n=1 Tax=Pneumocystis murina (strain B123) TaxID=1069680 RepID=M7PCQ4_PNEMU|nr:hypothetical protein PNEG_03407 [Pneumocystis murina B123]EMR08239.1 hypothetical protein PNEG_03407 [Pneumocystis murina B123]
MKQEPFTSLSFPLERYSYATQKDEASQRHCLSNIEWFHYPHRDLEIQFEMNNVSGHDEVTMKITRGAILFEQLNITRLSRLKIPLFQSENGPPQSGIIVITRAPCIGIKWYNDVSRKISRFQMKFSTEDIFHSVRGILEQHVGKIRNAIDSYSSNERVSLKVQKYDKSSDHVKPWIEGEMEEPQAKKIYGGQGSIEPFFPLNSIGSMEKEPISSLADLRFPTPSNTNRFLYLNPSYNKNQNEWVSSIDELSKMTKENNHYDPSLSTELIKKKKLKKSSKTKKNLNDLKKEPSADNNSLLIKTDVGKKKTSTVKKLPTPPRTASYESSLSLSQENTDTLEEMIVSYINDHHFLQLIKKVDTIWKKLGFTI